MARQEYDPALAQRVNDLCERIETLLELPEETIGTWGQGHICLTPDQVDALLALAETRADRGINLTREQVEEWAGTALVDDEWVSLEKAIPHSSIPDAIAAITAEILRPTP